MAVCLCFHWAPVLADAKPTTTILSLQWKQSSWPFCSQIHTNFMLHNTVSVFSYEHVHCNAIIGGGIHILIEGTLYSRKYSSYSSRLILLLNPIHKPDKPSSTMPSLSETKPLLSAVALSSIQPNFNIFYCCGPLIQDSTFARRLTQGSMDATIFFLTRVILR